MQGAAWQPPSSLAAPQPLAGAHDHEAAVALGVAWLVAQPVLAQAFQFGAGERQRAFLDDLGVLVDTNGRPPSSKTLKLPVCKTLLPISTSTGRAGSVLRRGGLARPARGIAPCSHTERASEVRLAASSIKSVRACERTMGQPRSKPCPHPPTRCQRANL
jgi:hypothetical protein